MDAANQLRDTETRGTLGPDWAYLVARNATTSVGWFHVSTLQDAADWRTKYDIPSSSAHVGLSRSERDVVIIGGGHNGEPFSFPSSLLPVSVSHHVTVARLSSLSPPLPVSTSATARQCPPRSAPGLIAAAYLAKAGLDVLVLERRPIVGGAAVTEELVPGFKFSRASYLAGLLRPQARAYASLRAEACLEPASTP